MWIVAGIQSEAPPVGFSFGWLLVLVGILIGQDDVEGVPHLLAGGGGHGTQLQFNVEPPDLTVVIDGLDLLTQLHLEEAEVVLFGLLKVNQHQRQQEQEACYHDGEVLHGPKVRVSVGAKHQDRRELDDEEEAAEQEGQYHWKVVDPHHGKEGVLGLHVVVTEEDGVQLANVEFDVRSCSPLVLLFEFKDAFVFAKLHSHHLLGVDLASWMLLRQLQSPSLVLLLLLGGVGDVVEADSCELIDSVVGLPDGEKRVCGKDEGLLGHAVLLLGHKFVRGHDEFEGDPGEFLGVLFGLFLGLGGIFGTVRFDFVGFQLGHTIFHFYYTEHSSWRQPVYSGLMVIKSYKESSRRHPEEAKGILKMWCEESKGEKHQNPLRLYQIPSNYYSNEGVGGVPRLGTQPQCQNYIPQNSVISKSMKCQRRNASSPKTTNHLEPRKSIIKTPSSKKFPLDFFSHPPSFVSASQDPHSLKEIYNSALITAPSHNEFTFRASKFPESKTTSAQNEESSWQKRPSSVRKQLKKTSSLKQNQHFGVFRDIKRIGRLVHRRSINL